MVAGAARIRVTFQVDADGLLSVTARELGTGIESHIAVKPSYGLTDDEVATMLRDSYAHAQDDMSARNLAEARVDAQRLVEATAAALAENGALLLAEHELSAIEKSIADLKQIIGGNDLATLKRASEALNKDTVEFAARRMDQSVKKALTGHKLDELDF
jgi:molecular chaperone HscA